MKLFIYSIEKKIQFKSINLINLFLKNKCFSIMKNYNNFICDIINIHFFYNYKKYKIVFLNATIINNKYKLKIICDFYNFL
ncbi:putative F0F1-type ATP synthase epsilon subunit [Candidatus Carsonella ruddii CS isolate Thao2000]|uniref:Putative F0F1-type ATP synthase epsilon subunit n=1 Tax=Candidatus Carsonella ruddii CS isolate Thao2000 TaxID=1202537 RepID=J7H062_CARRU|nr:hypothetical protein [Candidatus Carsonella ruddii]AFP83675.1 putative F0F1-type ATP synthase epsilon subunit [Candidatus Carsonella ruddii CS isolate Thao2000]